MIYETIVTTPFADGGTHIAPMGIRQPEADMVLINPFRPSATLDNLLRDGVAIINHTDDVRIFAGCLTGRRDWPLAPGTQVACQRLEAPLAHLEVQLHHVEDDELRPRLFCKIVHQETHRPFRGFNRAQAAVLEAAILASRLHMLPWEKIESEMAYLRIAIDKTAGPQEQEAWDWLVEKIMAHHQAAGAPA